MLQQLGWLRNSLSGSDAAAADAPASSPHPSAGVGAGASADAPVEDPGSWVFGQQAPARSQRPPVCSQQLAISCLRRSVQASEQSEITRPPCVQRAENHCVRYRCALHPPVVTDCPPPVCADPQDHRAWYLLGRCYMSQQQHVEAHQAYERAVNIEEHDPTYWCAAVPMPRPAPPPAAAATASLRMISRVARLFGCHRLFKLALQ